MTRDVIVDEVRALRDDLAREYGYDIDAIFQALRRMEQASGKPHVRFPPRLATEEAPEQSVAPDAARPSSNRNP